MPLLCETGGINAYVPDVDNPWDEEWVLVQVRHKLPELLN